VVPDRAAKSIGAEDTFDEDLPATELAPHIHGQALRVARRLRRAGCKAKVVQLKLKLSDFQLLTRQTTLPEPTDDGQAIYRAAADLLSRQDLKKPVRLTGVSAHAIALQEPQLGLFQPAPDRAQRLNAALDRIADRFGRPVVVPADVAALGDEDPRNGPRRS
jgi:DNA polymerase-4